MRFLRETAVRVAFWAPQNNEYSPRRLERFKAETFTEHTAHIYVHMSIDWSPETATENNKLKCVLELRVVSVNRCRVMHGLLLLYSVIQQGTSEFIRCTEDRYVVAALAKALNSPYKTRMRDVESLQCVHPPSSHPSDTKDDWFGLQYNDATGQQRKSG